MAKGSRIVKLLKHTATIMILMVAVSSCELTPFSGTFLETADIKGNQWKADSAVTFCFVRNNNSLESDISIVARCTKDIEPSTVKMEVKATLVSDKRYFCDTVSFEFLDPQYRVETNRNYKLIEVLVPYRRRAVFSSDTLQVSLTPLQTVRGVTQAGLEITNAKIPVEQINKNGKK